MAIGAIGAVVAGDAGEAVALVVLDELIVGEPALVQLRLRLVTLGLGTLRTRLLLRDLGFLLGPVGLAGAG